MVYVVTYMFSFKIPCAQTYVLLNKEVLIVLSEL